jgi:plasmid segregation protein ParM
VQICAIDVGYSGLKIAAGWQGLEPQLIVRPAGAAPARHLARAVGDGEPDEGVAVRIGAERWLAGVDPLRYDGWQRSLHEDYTATPAYRALATAALTLQARATGCATVDCIVTGLPVAQAADPRRCDALRRLFAGRHHAEGGPAVEVRDVTVIAQPLGAYIDLISSTTDPDIVERAEEGTVLVLDPGYYSTDWAVISRGALREGASGTSLEAMSVIIERAAAHAAREIGGRPQPALFEAAARQGRATVLQAGSRVSVADCLRAGAEETVPVVMEAVRQALRRDALSLDLILLAGGGGTWFAGSMSDAFPGARVVVAREPALANVRGFFAYA